MWKRFGDYNKCFSLFTWYRFGGETPTPVRMDTKRETCIGACIPLRTVRVFYILHPAAWCRFSRMSTKEQRQIDELFDLFDPNDSGAVASQA